MRLVLHKELFIKPQSAVETQSLAPLEKGVGDFQRHSESVTLIIQGNEPSLNEED